jgi:hypothetical protein
MKVGMVAVRSSRLRKSATEACSSAYVAIIS